MKLTIYILFGLFAAQGLFAQAPDTEIVNALVKHWTTSKELTLAVANAMPDADYSFKASPSEMTFGGQLIHLSLGDVNYCSRAFGEKSPMEKPKDETKATAISTINAAFDYCIAGMQKMNDVDLEKASGANSVTKFELLWGGFTHAAHHRGQAEVYLRLKGITPPSYKF